MNVRIYSQNSISRSAYSLIVHYNDQRGDLYKTIYSMYFFLHPVGTGIYVKDIVLQHFHIQLNRIRIITYYLGYNNG